MQVAATLRYARISPQKCRLMADAIRGKDVDEARRVDAEHGAYVSLKYNIAKQREGARDLKGKFIFKNHIGRFH